MIYFVVVEDVSDLWPAIKKGFEDRLPFKKAFLNNKTRNPVLVDELPAEFILTTDARLRSRFPQEQSLFWFREPYATVVLVTCEVRFFATRDIFKLITLLSASPRLLFCRLTILTFVFIYLCILFPLCVIFFPVLVGSWWI